jgi:hypothetical protein
MIEINTHHTNLSKIVTPTLRSQFEDLDAYFFGLKDETNRSDVTFNCYEAMPDEITALANFLSSAGLTTHLRECEEDDGKVDEYTGVTVGLNRRLREDIPLCKRLVVTILTALQGNLAYDCGLSLVRKPVPVLEVVPAAPSAPTPVRRMRRRAR